MNDSFKRAIRHFNAEDYRAALLAFDCAGEPLENNDVPWFTSVAGCGGTLVQPAGIAGCIGQGMADCASAPLLTAPVALAIGSDGTSLTVATAGDGAILTLHRDVATGALAPNAPPSGCISTTAAAGCQPLAQLGATTSLPSPRAETRCTRPPPAG